MREIFREEEDEVFEAIAEARREIWVGPNGRE
jgi:uncharacterized protein YlzI (FlbEa/FlbD family)